MARKQRFVAPPRDAVPRARFDHPAYAALAAHQDLLVSEAWPAVATLDARLGAPPHPAGGPVLRFVRQSPELLADGLHYETRIRERGLIATREADWHDLFNALAWIVHRELKGALNLRQACDVARVGPSVRTRGQYALTQFDEAGAVVVMRDAGLLARWDAHDWPGLFHAARDAWRDGGLAVVLFGHALHEHLLRPLQHATAKALVGLDDGGIGDPVRRVAAAIAAGTALVDPQDLRPLPLAGIPGWFPGNADPGFLASAPCFRPLRPGRRYPAPLGCA